MSTGDYAIVLVPEYCPVCGAHRPAPVYEDQDQDSPPVEWRCTCGVRFVTYALMPKEDLAP